MNHWKDGGMNQLEGWWNEPAGMGGMNQVEDWWNEPAGKLVE